MSPTPVLTPAAWPRLRRLLWIAAITASLACADSVGPRGPRVTIALLSDLSPDSVLVDAETPGRVEVTARIRFTCDSHPLIPRVQEVGDALTLTVERRFPDFTLCRIGASSERSYRAEVTSIRSGTWTLRVVHTYPELLSPPPPDTVFLGSIVVP